MNIFVLDSDPELCARYHCDKHVVKMCVEYAQILSTATHIRVPKHGLNIYKPTHVNHPCVKWACESWANYNWLRNLAERLCTEYTYRYERIHASQRVIALLPLVPTEDEGTPFVQCMPDDCKVYSDSVTAYRQYYCKYKSYFTTWKRSPIPDWFAADTLNVAVKM